MEAASSSSSRPLTSRPMTGSRPLTSTGLIAPRTARGKSGVRRQVQDKSYFLSLLRSKMNELSAEMAILSKECDTMAKEESRSGIYHRKAETLAKELSVMTQELSIYNEYNDRLRIGEEDNEIKEDNESIMIENKELTIKLEASYEQKRRQEDIIRNYENELQQIQNNWNTIKLQFTPEESDRYETLAKLNQQLSQQCKQLELEINKWKQKRTQIEMNAEDSDSLIKREILQAVCKLSDLEKQRNDLLSESSNNGDERGKLLAQVKRDNNEIAAMETRIAQINDQIHDMRSELDTYDDVDATEKYKELKKKEQTIDSFLTEFDQNKSQEIRKIENIGSEINELTGKLSRCLSHIELIKGNGGEGQSKENSGKSAIETLNDEKRKLELDLNKIEQLETKIHSEMDALKSKIKSLEADIDTYSDVPKLKAQIEEKLENHQKEKEELSKTLSDLTKTNDQLKSNLNTVKTRIENNDIHKNIKSLETKLSDILSTNESIKDTIKAAMNVNLKTQVLEEVKKYNQKLLGY